MGKNELTYHPGLIEEVIYGVERVDTGNPAIM